MVSNFLLLKVVIEILNGEGLILYWILKVWYMIVFFLIGDIFCFKELIYRVGCRFFIK